MIKQIFSRFIREPLVHFVLVGSVVFATFAALNERPVEQDESLIIVDETDLARIAEQFRATWLRFPTQEEMAAIVEGFVNEEVLVREALSLGLDQDDAVIRQRLRQKMDFITGASSEIEAPDENALKAYYDANIVNYTIDPVVTLEQIYLGPDASNAQITAVQDAVRNSQPPEGLGVPTLLPTRLEGTSSVDVDRSFGIGFYEALDVSLLGQWQGPIVSSFGVHFVRVESFEPGETVPLDAIEERVIRDWQFQNTQAEKAQNIQSLRARYDVQIADYGTMLLQ
ncbi:peptidyl-prolyl cis-trans isomerase (plasmid) [Falsihalocynthiibacter sp. SS001]|uniref:peptidylprolyl isomerase n=1 Tax=Falsihalocynthiibacter sp. SS001 TaxID=3349698 RepID=UPI0036D3FBC3